MCVKIQNKKAMCYWQLYYCFPFDKLKKFQPTTFQKILRNACDIRSTELRWIQMSKYIFRIKMFAIEEVFCNSFVNEKLTYGLFTELKVSYNVTQNHF